MKNKNATSLLMSALSNERSSDVAPRGAETGARNGACFVFLPTLDTFITSSPRWLITFTAIRPDFGLSKGREVSLCKVAQASSLISVGVHPGLERRNVAKAIEVRGVGLVAKGAGHEHIEACLGGFTGGGDKVGTRHDRCDLRQVLSYGGPQDRYVYVPVVVNQPVAHLGHE